jgi:ABC-type glycerol-3-phosphate transport system permease component
VIGSLAVASIGAYVFARFRFPGRELLFWAILGVLFVPGILTFATRFVVVSNMGLLDTYWVMIIPIIAGAQIFEMFVLRAFFTGLSEEILEAARVDGAGVMTVFTKIVLPMSRPILATLAVMRTIDVWNEWLWPMVTISKYELRPMALQVFWLQSDIGAHVGRQMAGYAIASIPLLILFVLFSKQFIEGLTSGSIKW